MVIGQGKFADSVEMDGGTHCRSHSATTINGQPINSRFNSHSFFFCRARCRLTLSSLLNVVLLGDGGGMVVVYFVNSNVLEHT